MFFGRGEPEDVGLGSLASQLDLLFEKKLGNMPAKAGTAVSNIRKHQAEFGSLCKDLEALDAEPYTEDIWMPNVNTIKNSKEAYASALRQIILRMDTESAGTGTSYQKYERILSSIDRITNEVLKMNATFKSTLYSYSKHMGGLKREFSLLEQHREELRRLLSDKSPEAARYVEVSGLVSELEDAAENLEILQSEEAAAVDKFGGPLMVADETKKRSLLTELAEMKTSLRDTDARISEHSGRITKLVLPLDRIAKKFDHAHAKERRGQLAALLENPLGRINSREDYLEFNSLLKALGSSIEKNEVDVKNKEETVGMVAALLGADVFGIINTMKSDMKRRGTILGEIKTLEDSIADLERIGLDREKIRNDSINRRSRITALQGEISQKANKIEELVFAYYGKRVHVVV